MSPPARTAGLALVSGGAACCDAVHCPAAPLVATGDESSVPAPFGRRRRASRKRARWAHVAGTDEHLLTDLSVGQAGGRSGDDIELGGRQAVPSGAGSLALAAGLVDVAEQLRDGECGAGGERRAHRCGIPLREIAARSTATAR